MDYIAAREKAAPSYLIWNEILTVLLTMDSLFCATHSADPLALRSSFGANAVSVVLPAWKAMDAWEASDADLRAAMIVALVRFEHADTIAFGADLLRSAMVDGEVAVNAQGEVEGVDANLVRGVLECALSSDATDATLTALMRAYGELNSEYAQYALRAIGAVYESEARMQTALDFIIGSGEVRDQDKLRALYSLRRCQGRQATWRYLADEDGDECVSVWDALFAVYGSGFSAQRISEIAATFATRAAYDDVFAFFYGAEGEKRRTSANERSVNETLEEIGVRVAWLQRNSEAVALYLEKGTTTAAPSGEGEGGGGEEEEAAVGAMDVALISLTLLITLLCAAFALRWLWRRRRSAQGSVSVYHRDGERMVGADEEAEADKAYNMSNLSIDDDDNTTHLREHDDDDERL